MRENCQNCMTVIVGKGVSASGRVLVAHNEDDPGHVIVRHAIVPAADHLAGETVPAEKGCARIPQVSHTLRYYWIEFAEDSCGLSTADAFLNECGVVITSNSMGETKEDTSDPSNVKEGGILYSVRRVLAERAHTAREGAQILIGLMNEWGYASAGRAYTIADKDEAFMFQLVRGHHYIGARVPDDAVVVMPNHYTFHTLHDCPEMFYPADLVDYAIEKGWYIPGTEDHSDFDFAAAYQSPANIGHAGNMLRQKNGQRIILGNAALAEKLGTPFCVNPSGSVSIEMLAEVMSTHYEGTPDDNESFGPGRSPHYFKTTRRICTGTTLESNLWEFSDDPAKTTVYTAFGRPCQVPYVPLHPLLGLPDLVSMHCDPAKAMENHLEAHPGITAVAYDSELGRMRRLCCLQEMLFDDVSGNVKPVLKQIFKAARAESAEVLSAPGSAVERDGNFIRAAVNLVEDHAAKLCREINVTSVSPIRIGNENDVITVSFECDTLPVEATIRFGLEYTNTITAFSGIREGSLNKAGENAYTAEFDSKPLMTVLKYPGTHAFWLGGRDANDKAFTCCIITEVR